MLQNIIAYVNHYFPRYKRDDINPNFVRFCLVYQFLLAHYLNKNATLDYIMLILDDCKNAFPPTLSIATFIKYSVGLSMKYGLIMKRGEVKFMCLIRLLNNVHFSVI